jgi:two-component system chemotaxis response regulator CheB
MRPTRVVVIGASWGGLETLGALLAALPPDLAAAVVIAQHRTRDAEDGLCEVLSRTSVLPLREVEDKDLLAPARAYLAPADYHVMITADGLELSVDPPVNHARPSIDVLFESAAHAFGAQAIGVLLTGLGRDGAAGLRTIHEAGGVTAVESPDTAASGALPKAAIELFTPGAVLPIRGLADFIAKTAGRAADAERATLRSR